MTDARDLEFLKAPAPFGGPDDPGYGQIVSQNGRVLQIMVSPEYAAWSEARCAGFQWLSLHRSWGEAFVAWLVGD